MRILVLGGAGFIGRHTVAALLNRGHDVVIGTRHPQRAGRRIPSEAQGCQRRAVRFEQPLAPAVWRSLIADIDVVINCVGILRPRGAETYEKVHHIAPAALADACSAQGVRRLLHISALGLDRPVSSGFLSSKRRGECAVLAGFADCVVVRPSLLDGVDGLGARWLRRVARWPVHVVPASAIGRLAPLHVEALASALVDLCQLPAGAAPKEVELGGAASMTMREYLAVLRADELGPTAPPATVVAIPHWLARIGSHICDLLHATPFSFGHLELMQHDNVPRTNSLPGLLTLCDRAAAQSPISKLMCQNPSMQAGTAA
jgi:uncharacterized protein YbjT (DUF2867 family)